MKTINKSKVLVGSDFEMFLQNEEGKFISAIPFNSGTKQEPEKIKDHIGCCIQRDGVLEECNVPPVRLGQYDEFWKNIQIVKDYVYTKFAKKEKLTLVCCPTANFEDDQLQDDEAQQAGCSPDFNAWLGGEQNEKPSFTGSGLRSAGFHVHLSFPDADVDTCMDLMKLFDLFITLPFVVIDTNKERRKLYGKAGCFRMCDWGEEKGFEARTLSNVAVSGKATIEYIFDQLDLMFDYYNNNTMDVVNEMSHDIISAINESDYNKAGKICDSFGILLLLDKEYA